MLEYFQYLNFIQFLEFLAACSGSYYVYRKDQVRKAVRILVYFLWATFFIEVIGVYAQYAYYSGYEKLSFLKNSPFQRNYWLYNIRSLFNYVVYTYFFYGYIQSLRLKRFLRAGMLFFFFSAVVNLLISDVFFKAHAAYTAMLGSVMILLSITCYYYETLRSDAILGFKYSLPTYITLGILVFELTMTPLKIYTHYFNEAISPAFVDLWTKGIWFSNTWLYGIFTTGFILCSRKKNYSLSSIL